MARKIIHTGTTDDGIPAVIFRTNRNDVCVDIAGYIHNYGEWDRFCDHMYPNGLIAIADRYRKSKNKRIKEMITNQIKFTLTYRQAVALCEKLVSLEMDGSLAVAADLIFAAVDSFESELFSGYLDSREMR